MTVAIHRPDDWTKTTTVGCVNEGLNALFDCGLDSQKAKFWLRETTSENCSETAKGVVRESEGNRISLTIDHDTADLMAISGLSMAARAQAVDDRAEAEKVLRILPLKYLDTPPLPKMPEPE
jgi:hypothetical protein